MNPDNTVEYNSLSWVKTQLDDVISDAQSSLNEYIENQTDGELENCIEHLQLIFGTLQMVEVYGASMLAEEMQLTTSALLKGDVDRKEDAYDVLMRAMLQLPDYLESIQAGKKDSPISLMPLINDLRAARKEGLLTESVLFAPDLESAELVSNSYNADEIQTGKLQDEARRLRTHYQLGLLDYIRNNKERAGLQRIKAVLHSLEKVSSKAEVRRIWMVVTALVEGLLKQGIDTNLSIKMLLAAVDRQLKLILDVGEEKFAEQYSKELVKNVLYYVGSSTVDTKAINAVKEAYQLSALIPQEDADAAVGGLNADLFDTVSAGITEDLVQVKDVLELFMFSSDHDVQQLIPVAEQLGKIADTYGMLGMGATRQSIMDQRVVLQGIIDGETEVSEQLVLNIASELLKAESELKDYIDSRSGFVDMNRTEDGDNESAIPASEYRQVVHTVVAEGLKNFSQAKEAILSYVSGIGDKEQLDIILNRLEEVRGVSMMLPLGRVESLIEKLQRFIRVALQQNNYKVSDDEQNTVADVVTAIEYFFEALSEGRPGVEQGLNAGDVAASKLDSIVESYGDTPQVIIEELDVQDASAEIEEENNLVEHELEIDDKDLEDISFEPEDIDTTASVASVSSQEIGQYAILDDDADEEIVEIFVEEAVEVLGELHEYLPQWRADTNNEEALAVVRRSFHTLKGSGRLLGAEMIGEFSWKFENMLNRVIDKKINVSDDLFNAMEEAVAVLPQLIEQLKGNREPIENISQLMQTADAIAEGREVVVQEIAPEAEELLEEPPVEDESEAGLTLSIVEDTPTEEKFVEEPVEKESAIEREETEVEETPGDEFDIALEEAAVDDLSEEDIDIMEEPAVNEFDVADAVKTDELIINEDNNGDREINVVAPEDTLVIDETAAIETESSDTAEDEELTETIDFDSDLLEDTSYDKGASVYEIEIDEDVVGMSDDFLDIDPMLLKIYYDESQGHIENIRALLDSSISEGKELKADKGLIRAFHTLYGSARTAEVESIADLSGSAERYVKVRQEGGEENIPKDAIVVLKEIEQAITEMLSMVNDGRMPSGNKPLQEKINRVVQQEIQSQLQKSWQDKSSSEDDEEIIDIIDILEDDITSDQASDLSINIEELSADATDKVDVTDATEELETSEIDKDVEEVAFSDAERDSGVPSAEETVILSYGEIDDELIDIFLEEAEELLESCEGTLNAIKSAPNATEHVHQLQRNMHTLKGGARMADLSPVGDLTHNLESLVVMVNEHKVNVDKPLFDLLHDSLDALTNMLASVKNREPLQSDNELNNRIQMMMRGEIEEKRSIERFDVELSELAADHDEELEEIDISSLLPIDDSNEEQKDVTPVTDQRKSVRDADDRPHWGERATDVNFKDSQEQVRVRSDLLNNLVNYAGEVNIYHARMGKQVTDFSFNLSELTQTVVRLKEQLRNLEIETEIQIRSGYEKEEEYFDADFDPLEMDQYSTLQQLTRSLSETAGDVESIKEILTDITRDSETLLLQESRVSTDLQEGLMRTRMVRFGGLSSRLRRIVRQVSRELGKEVDLQIIGEESEVDRTVLDRIIAPLEHMLRNAVAHGIEKPDIRKEKGKNETGKILIDVGREGTDVVINIKDDGAGINAAKVREKAIRQGLITEETDVSDRDVLQFILQSGFSTADEVTQVAGRGVGMDVVDSEIKQLGGVLDIDTEEGEGTEFTIRLPLTLAINQALLVSVSDDIFAVPLASIEGVVRMTGLELQRFYDSDNSYYDFNGVEYELKHLGGLLNGNQSDYSKQLQLFPVLLVRVGDKHFALHVDDMLGRREIVVKPVGLQIGAVRGIAGATILADGRVVLILEMSALVVAESLFRQNKSIEVVEPVIDDKKTIMVVDDSITIRKITERMLKRYGIDVVLAKDGVDATNILQDSIPDLMLLDIEMPRMDGFEVASYVRNDERLKDIPIIMITSRTGAKHKEKAMEIGVDEYLGKPFQEDELVKDINKILKTNF